MWWQWFWWSWLTFPCRIPDEYRHSCQKYKIICNSRKFHAMKAVFAGLPFRLGMELWMLRTEGLATLLFSQKSCNGHFISPSSVFHEFMASDITYYTVIFIHYFLIKKWKFYKIKLFTWSNHWSLNLSIFVCYITNFLYFSWKVSLFQNNIKKVEYIVCYCFFMS